VIRLTVMYPNGEDANFDMDYYTSKHIPMVMDLCGDAVKECSVEQGLGGGAPGAPAPYLVITRITVETMEDFEKSVAPHDPQFAADVPNFTNVIPVIQINEVVI
jgi:uncharacterized protein (TIGR02118 family)